LERSQSREWSPQRSSKKAALLLSPNFTLTAPELVLPSSSLATAALLEENNDEFFPVKTVSSRYHRSQDSAGATAGNSAGVGVGSTGKVPEIYNLPVVGDSFCLPWFHISGRQTDR
jgi:hypothetical protein